MFDFRLKVFYAVAKRLSFTKASAELFITQPAVTRHIRELESHLKTTLLERSGNKKIKLTPAGEILLTHAEKLMRTYRELEYDISLLQQKHAGLLRLGASTTVAQYVIPPVLAQFRAKFNQAEVSLITGNTEQIEQALINRDIDTGIIEGLSRQPQISYDAYGKDELVLVAATNNRLLKKDTLRPDELKNYPFLLREPGSGTLEVIMHALKEHHLKLSDLPVEMQLGSTESIKSYLLHSNCLAFLSVQSVLNELSAGKCKIIDVQGLIIERPFYFVQLHGQPSALSEQFIRFAQTFRGES